MSKQQSSSVRERIFNAARKLADEKPLDQIGLSEIARAAGVSWPTVKRYAGSREELREALLAERPELMRTMRATRTRLLEAALRAFARQGYERATIDDIAQEAGMTKGAVYWHFESKEELFSALLDEVWRNEVVSAPSSGTLGPGGARERLIERLASQLDALLSSPDRVRLLFDFATHRGQPELVRRLAEAQREVETGVAQIVSALQDAELIGRGAPAELVGQLWTAVVNGLALGWLLEPERADVRRAGRLGAELLIRALEASGGADGKDGEGSQREGPLSPARTG